MSRGRERKRDIKGERRIPDEAVLSRRLPCAAIVPTRRAGGPEHIKMSGRGLAGRDREEDCKRERTKEGKEREKAEGRGGRAMARAGGARGAKGQNAG